MTAAPSWASAEALRLDEIVSEALGRRPGEPLETAALRACREPGAPLPRRLAAHALLSDVGEPWERMRRAAELAQEAAGVHE